MPRPRGVRSQLEQAMRQLDTAINANPPVKPSVIKALESKIEVLSKMLTYENATKQSDIEQQLAGAQERLKQFDGIDPSKIQEVTEQNRTLRAQLENTRTSNSNLLLERDAAHCETAYVTTLLKWLTQRANQDRRLAIAVDAFVVHSETARPLIDSLMSVGTTTEWLRLASSKQRLIDTFAQHRASTNPDSVVLREFSRLYLQKKFDTDAVKVLQQRADSVRQANEADEKRHEQARFEHDLRVNRQRRDNAIEEMIRNAEVSNSTGHSRVEESW